VEGSVGTYSRSPGPESTRWITEPARFFQSGEARRKWCQEKQGIGGTRSSYVTCSRGKIFTLRAIWFIDYLQTSVTLEEIENVSGFIGRLEKIELPNQLVAVMGDPLLQKLLQLKSTDITRRRVDNWLMAFFEDQLENEENSEATLLDMLASIREYVRFTKVSAQTTTTLGLIMLIVKVLPPACAKYLHSLLGDWNGVTGREVILDLFPYTPIAPFEGICPFSIAAISCLYF